MNALIAKELGNKTNIQVGEKRRLPRNRSAVSRTTVPSARNVEDDLAFLNDRTCLPPPTSEAGRRAGVVVGGDSGRTPGPSRGSPQLRRAPGRPFARPLGASPSSWLRTVKKFNEARVNGGSNYDSLKVGDWVLFPVMHYSPWSTAWECSHGRELGSYDQTSTIRVQLRTCNERFSSISALERHFRSVHRGVSLLFECATCGKTDPRPQSISTHAPKCRGAIPAPVPAGDEWCCEACGYKSVTRSDLTQHKRHIHPALRNEERIAERSRAPAQKGRKPSLWSREDEERLAVLEVKYSGQKSMNILIAKELGNKTNIQVSEKRRLPRNRSAVSRTTVPFARNVEDDLAFLNDRTCLPPPTSEVGKHLPALVDAYVGTQGHNIARSLLQGLKSWSEGNEGANALLVSATVELLKPLLSHCGPGKRKRHFKSGQKGQEKVVRQPFRSWMGRRARKRGCYLRYQALFSGKRSRLASLILDGTDKIECQVPLAVVHETYKQKWETATPFKGLGAFTPFSKADNGVFNSLITEDEVRECLAAISPSSAAGPDKISKGDIREYMATDAVTAMFNAWFVTGAIPDEVKRCRSILIPKSANPEHLKEIGNWRPNTIGSMILRLYSRVLTKRLAIALPVNPRQRGFIQAPGCSENLLVLNTILKQAKRKHEHLAVVFIDIAKAFDSVSHEHILQVLQMRSLDNHVIGIIRNSYVSCLTSIEVDGERTPDIKIMTGVKQGDPMSPLLFNLAMDPLINMLESRGKGFPTHDGEIATLAFADDLVMLSHSWDGMSHNIKILEKFCSLTGLSVQAKKCHGFLLTPTHDSYTVNDCSPWKIGGADLHMIGPEESERYLGVGVSPWVGIAKPDMESQLHHWIQCIDEAPLKPSQKVVILNDFAIPRLMYQIDHVESSIMSLAKIDGLVRTAVKAWLRLPKSTCDGLLYSRCSDGGLGILRLARLIPSIQIR
ncbi:hypothetical protein SKAU_G00414270 [Synaphobranchus kaupii]|uniref:ribonuclease H n=1 Tax=Synaphobranchus kaupii TaxID=118154 RepID=A0A9Q1IBD2_SYNKA|nr:hypothetical protein SKAU_G00414270 [Synaphobranchus kaupii]